MKTMRVVGAVIVINGKILCAQRGPSKSLPYQWEFPGGKIEPGESPQEALKREIREELQCEITVGEQIMHSRHPSRTGTIDLTTYYADITKGTPVPTEHVQIKWLFPHELPELDWAPADIPTVEHIRHKNYY